MEKINSNIFKLVLSWLFKYNLKYMYFLMIHIIIH